MHNHPAITCQLSGERDVLVGFGIDNVPGCYAVFDAGVCLYVGRSRTLLTRIMAHWIDQKDGNGRQWRLGGNTEWYFKKTFAPAGSALSVWLNEDPVGLEIALIEALKPTYNGRRYESTFPFGLQQVVVSELNGVQRRGIIIGESRDKNCWRIRLDGNAQSTVYNYHKSRCEFQQDMEAAPT